jgi:hypothetical protein
MLITMGWMINLMRICVRFATVQAHLSLECRASVQAHTSLDKALTSTVARTLIQFAPGIMDLAP